MKRLPMRKMQEALRLQSDGFSGHQAAQGLGVGRATISEYEVPPVSIVIFCV